MTAWFDQDLRRLFLCGLGFGLLNTLLAPTSQAEHALPRIVSTHLCADQLALRLAAPEQILSVSYKSQDPQRSRYAERAQRYPGNGGSSEEIIQLQPDIVLASRRWRQHPQQDQFDALGIRIVVVPISKNWPSVFEDTQWLANQIGRSDHAYELLADVRQRLTALHQALQTPRKDKQSMLFLRPNGGSAGSGTHIDMLIEALGFDNYASEMGLNGWGQLSLEKLVMQPPDWFLLGGYVRDSAYAKSQLSRHPVLQNLLDSRPSVTLPADQGSCASWQVLEAAEFLAEQLSGLTAKAGMQPPDSLRSMATVTK